ncbi:GGDEF domain-containing protein [Actinoplanes sp. NPDC023801]|uniref:GGDEF domain-containing protein n=1 Tax=Actinoplanes sp. NPDC023801 TaxID=3154595 RepID=UPI0033DA0FF3
MRRDQWAALTWPGVLAVCVALRVYLGATDAPYLVMSIPYMAVSAITPVVVLIGILWHRPPHRAGWFLLFAAQVVYAIADGMTVVSNWLGDFLEPTPADVAYFLYYLLLSAAVLLFVRRRAPGWDIPSGVDALVVAISAGLLSWVYILQPLTADSELPLNAKLTQAAYPVLDLMVFILAIRLVMGTGTRGPVLYLLLGSMSLMFVVDTAYAVEGIADGSAVTESYLDAMWMTSLGMLGSAALHPGIRRFDQRSDTALPDASPARLAVLAVAVLMAPGVQFIQWLRGEPISVPLISAACAVMFLLVLARMSGLVAAQRRAAVTDSLTGLHTRRHFTHALAVECRRSSRTGHGVGLLVIDVDHFKRVNDGYGHPAGDRVLREVARRLTAGSRAGGAVARYGGEEFVVLAPHTGPGELMALAERLRTEVSGMPVDVGGELLAVTVSIGAAARTRPDPESLMRAADEALYAAKAAGRNRSVLSPPAPLAAGRSPAG